MIKKVVLVVGLIAALAAGMFTYKNSFSASLEPLTAESNEKLIIIELGSTPDNIGQQLLDEGIIADKKSFVNHARSEGLSSSLKAGTYLLDSSKPINEIVKIIAEGKEATNTITIVPGLSEAEIRRVFINAGFSESNVDSAFKTIQPKDYVDGVSAESLEGYIAPDTYSLGINASVEDYLIFALRQFNTNVDQDLLDGFARQGLSVNGATILASIVQQESSSPENQVKIAQVFLKRLDEGIQLGSDVTFFYAAEQLGVDPAIDLDSPYNTRRYPGLPPTPIGNFNSSALEAVANPADTDYLFFVAGDDGITYFSKTLAEHESLAAQHCIELCKL